MSDSFQHFKLIRDERGVITVSIDVQGSPVNLFFDEVVLELAQVVDELERSSPKLVVFRSYKPAGFLAGADVRRIRQIATADEARVALESGRQIFKRIERLPCPTVAVVHGVCLGGGLEFALAFRHRVARDDAATRLGLVETQLGIIPGWGGTQRLPKLVGMRAAMRMILEASKLTASEAAAAGLVDLAAPPEIFEAALEQFIADRLANKPLPARRRGLMASVLDKTWLGRWLVVHVTRHAIAGRARHYPALNAAVDAVAAGIRHPEQGSRIEKEGFVRLLFTDAARNLLELFFQRERAGKAKTWVNMDSPETRKVRSVAVIGGGTMGAGIAQLAAIQGFETTLKEISPELAEAGQKRVASLMDDAVKKGVLSRADADAKLRALVTTSEWNPVAGADLAIEAVIEREGVKREVFRELGRRLAPQAILATNTSSLTVGRVTGAAEHPERTAGLHFFNPVHRMQLVEVVRGPDTDGRTIGTLVEFVRKLGKTPVVVADGPGFLVNRILFPYLDEAVRLLGEGYATDVIDRAAVRFGMPMGPLELLDQVGLDVAADVAKSLTAVQGDPSPTPERLAAMAERGWLGRKSGHGFYNYSHGRRRRPTRWEDALPFLRSPVDDGGTSPTGMNGVQRRLIYPMINEAAHCLETGVADAAWMIDLAMVMGIGFAPFRGGPLRAADTWGIGLVVQEMEDLHRGAGARYAPCDLLKEMSRDGRKFHASVETPREAANVSGSV